MTMMKRFLTIAAVLTLTVGMNAQKKMVILPGNGHINVETFNKSINTNIDITKLSLSEIRVLRNAPAARQGYCFMKADLRGIFEQTSWYDSIAMEREEGAEKSKPIRYTAKEQAFINKLDAREKEMRKNNFTATDGNIVNADNIVNPFQMESFSGPLKGKLAKNGFAIVPRKNIQLFHIYENNDYHDFPNFVTTDLYMQLFHSYNDFMLRNVEDYKLMPLLTDFCKKMHDQLANNGTTTNDVVLKEGYAYNAAFYAIGYQLLTGKSLEVDAKYAALVADEIAKIENGNNDFSEFLDFHDAEFPYSLFRPRGHYTRSNSLKRYFKAMMWFQTAPFCLEKDTQLRHAIIQATVIGESPDLTKQYKTLTEPITYLFGLPDNVTINQLYEVMDKEGFTEKDLLRKERVLDKFRTLIQAIAEKQTKILPKDAISCKYKINLMPQHYMPDNEVLQELVDVKTLPNTLRDKPKGLDVFAAFGSSAAERILLQELREGDKWQEYSPKLNKMKEKMKEVDWNATVSNKWMQGLSASLDKQTNLPYFMQTPQWDKKNLNAALASWAELKHDAILYAKQPEGAECGGGGLPEPIVSGYVEPNINYWAKAIELLNMTEKVLQQQNLMTADIKKQTNAMREMAQMLLNISNKELSGKTLTEAEYKTIEIIGSTAELLTLDFVKKPGQYLQSWDDVQGADKSVAVVADVYTANALNNNHKSVLYEGVGHANEIYVIVEIGGYLYLTRGAVLSYREFDMPLENPRMTDEEWQNQLNEKPNKGVPSWMDELLVPDTNVPQDNETYFYSSGC